MAPRVDLGIEALTAVDALWFLARDTVGNPAETSRIAREYDWNESDKIEVRFAGMVFGELEAAATSLDVDRFCGRAGVPTKVRKFLRLLQDFLGAFVSLGEVSPEQMVDLMRAIVRSREDQLLPQLHRVASLLGEDDERMIVPPLARLLALKEQFEEASTLRQDEKSIPGSLIGDLIRARQRRVVDEFLQTRAR